MDQIVFYFEWLGVDKNQFRILALLAPTGSFIGNLSDMCRKLNISTQQNNREKIKSGIKELSERNYITSAVNGRIYSLNVVPKERVIKIPAGWLNRIQNHNYNSESVSWQAVLKVMLWILANSKPTVTRAEIAETLNIGVDTVTSALKVLQNDFNAILREIITKRTPSGEYRRTGLEIIPSAFWK